MAATIRPPIMPMRFWTRSADVTGGLSAACTVAVKTNTSATGRQMKRLKKWDRLIVNVFIIGSLPSLLEFDVYPLSRTLFNPEILRHPKPTVVVCPEPVARPLCQRLPKLHRDELQQTGHLNFVRHRSSK